jgi:hypothetical protein
VSGILAVEYGVWHCQSLQIDAFIKIKAKYYSGGNLVEPRVA